uniref:Uncharacterized protein n=1 Tax=Triticum urartu TaxID=4572 RepID=A0A8R7NYR4_TRIUA
MFVIPGSGEGDLCRRRRRRVLELIERVVLVIVVEVELSRVITVVDDGAGGRCVVIGQERGGVGVGGAEYTFRVQSQRSRHYCTS